MTRICTVCKIPIVDNYCSSCGQKMKKEETTVRSIVSDFFQNLFSLDKSVFAAIYGLLINPRKIISNYWSGYRRYYPSPGKLLVYAMTIAAIQVAFIEKDILGLTLDLEEVKGQFLFWILFFPILTINSILSFYKLKLNFAKHIVSTAYIASSFFIIFSIINSVLLLLGKDYDLIPFLFFLIAVFIWNAHTNIQGSKIKVLLFTLLQIFTFVLILTAITGIIYLIAPDSINF